MKKIILSLSISALFYQNSNACSWYDSDYEYFNLFTQNIIKDKSLSPFLLTYSNAFYSSTSPIQDENISDWQQYFNQQLSYQDCYELVYKISLNDLNLLKKGTPSHPLLQKLGANFYPKYKEGIDYLIEAKYLEPYMRINYIENPDAFYFRQETDDKNATQMDYNKTISSLASLFHSVKDKRIQLRYAFQMVRFNHYNRKYKEAVDSFQQFVKPLQNNGSIYYSALNQLAGAQRGLGLKEDANWNFFQVFLHSKNLKESAYTSMKLSDESSFQNLLKRAKNENEKAMAYFLLGYQDFNNPLPMMEEIYKINPQSELLQVLTARAINELERSYLPLSYSAEDNFNSALSPSSSKATKAEAPEKKKEQKVGFFQRIWNFIKSLFSSSPSKTTNSTSSESLTNSAYRIPYYDAESNLTGDANSHNYIDELASFIKKMQKDNSSEFWKITDAYIQFLNRNYKESNSILESISTQDPEYIAQINKMKMLNTIVAQPSITEDFENELYQKFPSLFSVKAQETTSSEENYDFNPAYPSTEEFLKDVLANRYFLQGDLAKSFLTNNSLEDFRVNPNLELAQQLESFYRKPNKNNFEEKVLFSQMKSVGNLDAYFNVIYGDFAMKKADFKLAKKHYEKAQDFSGYPLNDQIYNYETGQYEAVDTSTLYNGFKNIPALVFGHNKWESFNSSAKESMQAESFLNDFPFIQSNMNKLDLANTLLQLEQIGASKDEKSSQANQLIGNLLYNTSALGYFRELFVMDIDNTNGGKYDLSKEGHSYKVYYKNYSNYSFFPLDNFNLSINFYQKALQTTSSKERKARILFQMASAEQGKYYQYITDHPLHISYDDPDYSKKLEAHDQEMIRLKNEKYRRYFSILKKDFSDTQTAHSLMGSCSYYQYFMKN
ncbi:hypothetical protein [Elizabethkingia sp. JS20170427COW]|uniref:hypothetical protein n=1 Tax=Elizabethkingia sp. JS20170427COW TaxID=2583851 RepID=UPI00111039FF|nr:hypothetical protein [Elizabethkingia sp. JS20170427COW]QCX52696.1 hypothetical protein FGE20_02505 [Elizabethkingia sp. JS20170427COW]